MKDFSNLDPRTLIFLALARLREKGATTYFSKDEIYNWINENAGEGKYEKTYIGNILSDIKNNKKGANTFVLKENGKKIGEVEELISFNTNSRSYVYSLGDKTVENTFSASIVGWLGDEAIKFANLLSKTREDKIIIQLYEEFKQEHDLTNKDDVKEKIDDAINALYFVRDSKGRLKPTSRFLVDENAFIHHLSKARPSLKDAKTQPKSDSLESKSMPRRG